MHFKRPAHCILLALSLASGASGPSLAWPLSREIRNVAQATYSVGTRDGIRSSSNTVVTLATPVRTNSSLQCLQYAPSVPAAHPVLVEATQFSNSDSEVGPFLPVPPPVVAEEGEIDLSRPVPLVGAVVYHQNEPVFIQVSDPDQNRDPQVQESVIVRLDVDAVGEHEVLEFKETGEDTGVFLGYIQTVGGVQGTPFAAGTAPAVPHDGWLSVVVNCDLRARYSDRFDVEDVSSDTKTIDPWSMVFNSRTGRPMNGVSLTLVDAETGRPADVRSDDGSTSFPATVASGGNVTDGAGGSHIFPPGLYRFPFVRTGRYKLVVTPPVGYAAPSTVETADLQRLPGAPFTIAEPGSRSEPFIQEAGHTFRIDVPVDPTAGVLSLMKSVDRETAGLGDFVPYALRLSHLEETALIRIGVRDVLPPGFRYTTGSTTYDGIQAPDPAISSNGDTLTFSVQRLESGAATWIRYVTEVTAGARPGRATNSACALIQGRPASDPVEASVRVEEDLLSRRARILGQVLIAGRGSVPGGPSGLAGVRIHMEDGRYCVTDARGRFHFEGVNPGTHVVRMDETTLPKEYIAVSRAGPGRDTTDAVSRLVDLQGGTLWRLDFEVARRAAVQASLGLKLSSLEDADEDEATIHLRIWSRGSRVGNLRVMVALPDTFSYVKGTSRRDDQQLPDPSFENGIAVYRLGDLAADGTTDLTLKLDPSTWGERREVPVKVVALFDCPSRRNVWTHAVEWTWPPKSIEAQRQRETMPAIGETEVEIPGDPPGGTSSVPTEEALPSGSMPSYDEAWLDKAVPGKDWLWPPPGVLPPIPTQKVALQHYPDEIPVLRRDGVEVSRLCFDGTLTNQVRSIAVSRWSGIELHQGDNLIEVVFSDTAGRERGRLSRLIHYSGPPVSVALVKEQSCLVASGTKGPVLAVRLADESGYPVCQGIVGTVAVDPPYALQRQAESLQEQPLGAIEAEWRRYKVGKNGIAILQLAPTTQPGEVLLRFQLDGDEQEVRAWLSPESRDWILVALAEGTLGLDAVQRHAEALPPGEEESGFYKNGRIAFYARGRVQGKWLLTLAYDSEKSGSAADRSLFQAVDPEAYYPLYGDATVDGHDAPGAEKLYVRLEREEFYLLFGDYNTGLTVTDLARYSRSFTGLKAEGRIRRAQFNAFASRSSQAFIRDEIPGDGTSGIYALSLRPVILNSEKLTIEVRDRFRSEILRSQRTLGRFIDYQIDYEAGTIRFKEPIPSKDESFNPIFIVAEYESNDDRDRSYNYGGRGAITLASPNLEIGSTLVHEGLTGANGDLAGADGVLSIQKQTLLRVEYAHSRKDSLGQRTEGSAYLAKLAHQSQALAGSAYLRQQDAAFGLGQQRPAEAGTRKLGLDLQYPLRQVTLRAETYRQQDLVQQRKRDVGEVGADFSRGLVSARAGFRTASDRSAEGATQRSDQAMAAGTLRLLESRLHLQLGRDQSLGNNSNVRYPTRTTFGADYQLVPAVTVFAQNEFTEGKDQKTGQIRAGLRAAPWSGAEVGSSLERRYSEEGGRLFASLGLKQVLRLTTRWTMNAGLDRSLPVKGADVGAPPGRLGSIDPVRNFTAVALGMSYRAPVWSANTLVERRVASDRNKWGVVAGVYGEADSTLGLSGRVQGMWTEPAAGPQERASQVRLGMVYRPLSARWIALLRIDLVQDGRNLGGRRIENRSLLGNANINYMLGYRVQIGLQYEAKNNVSRILGRSYSGFTDLSGLEGRCDLGRHWDVESRVSVLHSWNAKRTEYSTRLMLGRVLMRKTWISLGYNLQGLSDSSFSGGAYSRKGPVLAVRLRWNEATLREVGRWFGL